MPSSSIILLRSNPSPSVVYYYQVLIAGFLILCNTCSGSNSEASIPSSASPSRSPSSPYPSHIKLRAAVFNLHSPPYAIAEEAAEVRETPSTSNTTNTTALSLFHGLQLDLLQRIQHVAAQDGVTLEVDLNHTIPLPSSSQDDDDDDVSSAAYDAALDRIANDHHCSSDDYCNQFDLILGDYAVTADRSMRVDFTPPWNNHHNKALALEADTEEEASSDHQHMMMMIAWPMSYSLPPLTARLIKKWMYTIVTNGTAMTELYSPYLSNLNEDETIRNRNQSQTATATATTATVAPSDLDWVEGGEEDQVGDDDILYTTSGTREDTIPLGVLNDDLDSADSSPSWKGLAYGMLGINLVVILACAAWIWMYRSTVEVRASQPFFMVLVLIGCLLSSLSILALTLTTTTATTQEDDPTDNPHGCMAIPWLYSVGFCITFGTLFAKILRIYTIFTQASNFQTNNNKMLRKYSTSLTSSMFHADSGSKSFRAGGMVTAASFAAAANAVDLKPMESTSSVTAFRQRVSSTAQIAWDNVNFGETIMVIAIFLAIDICILVVWTVVDPLTYQYDNDDDKDAYLYEEEEGGLGGGYCTSDHWQIFTSLIGCYHLIVLGLTLYLCVQARQIPRRYSESKDVAVAIMSNLQTFAVGIPILIIVSGDPSASLFVKSAIIWMNVLSVVVILFANLMWSLHVTSKKNDSTIDKLKMKNAVRHYSLDCTDAKSVGNIHHYSLEEEDLTTTAQGSMPNINTGGWLHELMGSGASNDNDDDNDPATKNNKNKSDTITSTATPTATPPTRTKKRRSIRVSSLAMGSAFDASDFNSGNAASRSYSSSSSSSSSDDDPEVRNDHHPLPARQSREKTVSWGMVSFSEVEGNDDCDGSSAPFALGNPQFYEDHSDQYNCDHQSSSSGSKRFGEGFLAQAAPRTPPRRRPSIGSSDDDTSLHDDDDDEIDIPELPCSSETKEEEEEEEIMPSNMGTVFGVGSQLGSLRLSTKSAAQDAPRRPLRCDSGSTSGDTGSALPTSPSSSSIPPVAHPTCQAMMPPPFRLASLVVKNDSDVLSSSAQDNPTETKNARITNRNSIPPRQPSRLISTIENESEEFVV